MEFSWSENIKLNFMKPQLYFFRWRIKWWHVLRVSWSFNLYCHVNSCSKPPFPLAWPSTHKPPSPLTWPSTHTSHPLTWPSTHKPPSPLTWPSTIAFTSRGDFCFASPGSMLAKLFQAKARRHTKFLLTLSLVTVCGMIVKSYGSYQRDVTHTGRVCWTQFLLLGRQSGSCCL